MNKPSAAVVTAAILLLLTGCSGAPDAAPGEAQGAGTSAKIATDATPEPVETPAVEDATPAYITEPGEVCDPHNLNDPICAVFYPDQSVLNWTSPERSREPLTSLADDEKISLAHQACENMSAGIRPSLIDTILIEGDPEQMADRNNASLYTIGAYSYCHEFIEATGDAAQPDRNARIVKFYESMTEDEAKAHFSDRIMPTPAELGY